MRKLLAASIVLFITLLGGCTKITELSERAIVQAVGIDCGDNGYRATVQYFSQGGSGGENQLDSSESNVLKGTGEGRTLYDALRACNLRGGKSMMFSENQIIIIGDGFSEEELLPILIDMYRVYRCSADTLVCASEGTAEELLDIRFKEGITSTDKLKKLIENASETGNTMRVTLFTAVSDLLDTQGSTFLPLFKITETPTDVTKDSENSEDGKEKTAEFGGGVVVKDGMLSSEVSITAAQGIQLLRNQVESMTVSVETTLGMTDFEVFDIRVSVVPFGSELFSIDTSASIRAKGGETGFGVEAANAVSSELVQRMSEALNETVLDSGADAAALGKVLRNHDYRLFQQNMGTLEEYLKGSEFAFSTRCRIV